ncbi:MAG: 30S ribosomal protein S11 [Candidatus Magasanikbacteria bacterium CG10_big_fil_rev_8_21_14_0_10_40_10]|uniref:Small ribosomal subunit protein uS11 n=1 Tax=Candidatus Magasanikbacteria bacterium CG10_big_fil_rev_8_21_14_0_10_40_10 TaxID=1974648 RepID=A0A2M6W4U5_9BACT|nr:MAG: 30S ribosomal protein S11 [Candidatus Magasanikbacteria bacterium CG10_big_fil_rev_8_21_14_0_10_40_10]
MVAKNEQKKTTKKTVAKKLVKKKKKVIKAVSHGNAYIQATYNNTLISLTDTNGNVLSWASSGQVGFKGPKKATPYAASQVVKKAVENALPYGLKEVHVYIKGIGGGREGAIRALNTNGLIVSTITDVTPIPHNGCRPPKRRRV